MFDFSGVVEGRRQVPEADVAIEIGDVEVMLRCRPAREENAAYHAAFLRANLRGASRGRLSARAMRKLRREDARLFARHCVVGWDAESIAPFAGGEALEFTRERCLAFFESLIDEPTGTGRDAFDDFRIALREAETFMDVLDPDDVTAKAGNSPRG